MSRDRCAVHDALELKLAKIESLVAGLHMVAWSFEQHRVEDEIAQVRNAIIGIHYAMEREIEAA